MHLYVIRVPEMDLVWHLHPERGDDGNFTQQLPAMPAGRYALYGDVVHANGLAETATAEVNLPQIAGRPLTGDDAGGAGPAGVECGLQSHHQPARGRISDGLGSRRTGAARQAGVRFPLSSGRRERPARAKASSYTWECSGTRRS